MALTFAWGSNTITLNNSNYITDMFRPEDGRSRNINQLQIARSNGVYIVEVYWGARTIHFEGTLVYATQTALETELDNMKRILSGDPLNKGKGILTFDYAGGTRECEAILVDIASIFQRRREDINKIDYSFDFIVPTGEIRSTTLSAPTPIAITGGYTTSTVTYNGTQETDAVYTLDFSDPTPTTGTIADIEISNTTTGQSVSIPTNLVTSPATIIFDGEQGKVLRGTTNTRYYGIIPKAVPGANDYSIQLIRSSSIISSAIGSQSGSSDAATVICGTRESAQPFTNIAAITNVKKIKVFILRNEQRISGTYGDITLTVETDTAGNPSGVPLAGSTIIIPAAKVMVGSPSYVEVVFPVALALAASTQYWVRLKATSTVYPNAYQWIVGGQTTFGMAPVRISNNSGTNWASYGELANFIVYDDNVSGLTGTLALSYVEKYL